MDNSNPHGFFPRELNHEPSPPPISSAVSSHSTTPGSSADPQRGRGKGSKDAPVRLHGHDLLGLAGASKHKIKKKPPDPSSADATSPCTECGKRFWSQKALFGHMRCHPERQWRGINPPPHFRRPQPTFCSPSPPIQRPRLPPGAQQLFHDVEHEVAAYLLMLANGPTPAATPEFMVDGSGPMDGTKSFGSQQAHGGPWSGYKNVAACLAIRRNEGDEEESGISSSNNDSPAARGGISSGRRAAEGMVMMGSDHRRDFCPSASLSSGHVEHKGRDRGDEGATFSPLFRGYVPDLNLPPPLENSEFSA